MSPNHHAEYITIAVYLVLMVLVGFVFKRFTRNAGDYFKSGSRGAWWLVGVSLYMNVFSAWTFTGAAGLAYSAGWTVLWGTAGGVAGYFLNYLWFARWFRQLRATTGPEVIAMRFGQPTRQFYAWTTVVTTIPIAALQLYALAIFCASVFQLDVASTILLAGVVVIFYTVTGGTWSIMATDFVQALILLPLTLVLAAACLWQLQDAGGLFGGIEQAGLKDSHALLKPAGVFSNGAFTWVWGVALFARNLLGELSLSSSARYFSAKDGRDAAKAALLCCALLGLGMVIWFVPPITARLLYANEIGLVGRGLAEPTEAAYVLAGIKLLPAGFSGVLVISMFAATMSGMDAGLARNAAVIVRDICPLLYRRLDLGLSKEQWQLSIGRWITVILGVVIIACAFGFSNVRGVGIFELMTKTNALLTLPLGIPLVLGIFIRSVPSWTAILTVSAGLLTSLIAFNSDWIFGHAWNLQTTIFANIIVEATVFLGSMAFWRTAPRAYRNDVRGFFELMKRPVDFEREVGAASDPVQLRLLGYFAMLTGLLFFGLLLIPNPLRNQVVIIAIGGVVSGAGVGMFLLSTRLTRRQRDQDTMHGNGGASPSDHQIGESAGASRLRGD